jgi:hypothetical protein
MVAPVISSGIPLIAVVLPSAEDLKAWYTPHPYYEPDLEDMIGDMISTYSDLADLFRDAARDRKGWSRGEVYLFDATTTSVEDVTAWLLDQPEMAPYL